MNSEDPTDLLGRALSDVQAVQLVGCTAFTHVGEVEDEAYRSYEGQSLLSRECVALRRQLGEPRPATTGETFSEGQPRLGVYPYERDSSGACWGVQVRPQPVREHTYSGKWRLVRRDREGTLAFSPEYPYRGLVFNLDSDNLPPECLGFFDFDNDRRPEAITVNRYGINNQAQEKRVRLWALNRTSSLRPYPPTANWVAFGVADFDGDGRPDLAINPYAISPREPAIAVGGYPRHSDLDWGLIARAEPSGKFSLDSELSRRAASRLCPTAPAVNLPQKTSEWPNYLHCARLWGRDAGDLESQIRSACSAVCDQMTTTVCQNGKAFLDALLRANLPFKLTP